MKYTACIRMRVQMRVIVGVRKQYCNSHASETCLLACMRVCVWNLFFSMHQMSMHTYVRPSSPRVSFFSFSLLKLRLLYLLFSVRSTSFVSRIFWPPLPVFFRSYDRNRCMVTCLITSISLRAFLTQVWPPFPPNVFLK